VLAQDGSAVVPGSPADKLGLSDGDIITKIDDKEITPERSLATILRTYRPADQITVDWISQGVEHTDQVQLDAIGN
ncbi:MAG: PDZ domain-containing protein, partial [bacterium]|nr:PDZ domain-containing protein [bacterium]